VFIKQTPWKEAPSEAAQVRVFSKPSESKLRIRLLPTLAKQYGWPGHGRAAFYLELPQKSKQLSVKCRVTPWPR